MHWVGDKSSSSKEIASFLNFILFIEPIGKIRITKRLRRIPNAWHFWFTLNLMFTVQYFKSSGLRCSPLNAALSLSLYFNKGGLC